MSNEEKSCFMGWEDIDDVKRLRIRHKKLERIKRKIEEWDV